MQPSDFDQLRGELDRHFRDRSTHLESNPAEIAADRYVSASWLTSEMSRVFESMPLVACAASEIGVAGCVLARKVGGWPLLFVRQADGRIRSFLNACRHRGSILINEERSCPRRLVCDYHGWSYRPDGRLAGRPNDAAFDPDPDLGLIELPCHDHVGLVWVTLDHAGTCTPGDYLDELDGELTSMLVENHVAERSLVQDVNANWKLVVEGFLEMYHVRHLHPSTLAPHQPGDIATYRQYGVHSRVVAPRRSYECGTTEAAKFLKSTLFVYHIFPNSILSWLTDHFEMWQFTPHFSDPGRTEARWTVLVPPDQVANVDAWDENQRIVERTVFGEDWPVAESIQVNAAFVARHATLLAGRNEPAIQRFHTALDAAMTSTHRYIDSSTSPVP